MSTSAQITCIVSSSKCRNPVVVHLEMLNGRNEHEVGHAREIGAKHSHGWCVKWVLGVRWVRGDGFDGHRSMHDDYVHMGFEKLEGVE